MRVWSKTALLGLVSVGVVAVGGFTLRVLAQQRSERMSAALASVSSVLTMQVRRELEHLVTRITEIGEQANGDGVLTKADYGLVELSIWEKEGIELVRRADYRQPGAQSPAQIPAPPGPNSPPNSPPNSLNDEFERQIATQGFLGRTLIMSDLLPGQPGQAGQAAKTAVIVVPIGRESIRRVAIAHFRLDEIQRAFREDGGIESTLVNSAAIVLAHPKADQVGTLSPFVSVLTGLSPSARAGEFDYRRPTGEWMRATYHMIPLGQLAIIASAPRADAELSTQEKGVFWALIVLLLIVGGGMAFVGGRPLAKRFGISPIAGEGTKTQTQTLTHVKAFASPEWKRYAVLHVALWPYDRVLSQLPPEETVEVLNQFFEIVAIEVKESGGHFERAAGASLLAVWEDPTQAILSAIALRKEFMRYAASRKVDGRPALTMVMGADWGHGLVAKVGSRRLRGLTVVGEVVFNARSLALLAPSVRTDLLVSHAFWENIEKAFAGERAAEANLTSVSGLTACYRILGMRGVDGNTVLTDLPEVATSLIEMGPRLQEIVSSEMRWMVNNGTQIIGPFSPDEIAVRLHAVDIDFDCECWQEGAGRRATIARSGMFGEAADEIGTDADLWVFDGKTIHGPMSEGFLRTAVSHGAVQANDFVCAVTTISGWKRIFAFLAELDTNSAASTTVPSDPAAAA
jgi:class 3 adenylate cyclase